MACFTIEGSENDIGVDTMLGTRLSTANRTFCAELRLSDLAKLLDACDD